MQTCEVCGLEYHSATAATLSAKYGHCGRRACPDCQRNMKASNGNLLGTYCIECVPKLQEEFRSVGEDALEFVQVWWGNRDSMDRPILQEEAVLLGLTVN